MGFPASQVGLRTLGKLIIGAVRTRLLDFLEQPELGDEGLLRLVAVLLMAAGGLFFFRLRALPVLLSCVVGGAAILLALWAGFHRLGARQLGAYMPGTASGLTVAILVFCLMPPGIPLVLAGLLAALAVTVEAVEHRAPARLALSGVTAAWLLAWIWQVRGGTSFIAPFDFHQLDEPITLWIKFQTAIEPVRTYAGQVAGPLGATSFGLVAIATLLVAYARGVSWQVVLWFYVPVLAVALASRLPLNVYLLNAPALAFVGLLAADARHLPEAVAWRVMTGFVGGAVAAALLLAGSGYQSFGIGVAASTLLVTVFQFVGLAGSSRMAARRVQEADPHGTARATSVLPAAAMGGRSPAQMVALAVCLPVGLALVSRDSRLEPSQRTALVTMGIVLYVLSVAGALTWLWLLRLPA